MVRHNALIVFDEIAKKQHVVHSVIAGNQVDSGGMIQVRLQASTLLLHANIKGVKCFSQRTALETKKS